MSTPAWAKTQQELVLELTGDTCRCGARKRRGQSFCHSCYHALPQAAQHALHQRIGQGYERAYAFAAGYLDHLERRA